MDSVNVDDWLSTYVIFERALGRNTLFLSPPEPCSLLPFQTMIILFEYVFSFCEGWASSTVTFADLNPISFIPLYDV
jgi:hypothetical protein